jgi:multiple sugar transport system permease protein
MIPYTVTMIPQFIIFRSLGWLDTYLPLVVPMFFGGIPFFIFLMRQFFLQIPLELDSAARIDGCSFFGIYWRICLPLARPALFTVAILGFVWEWNNLLGPLIYINTSAKRTIALALLFFRSEYTSHTGVNMLMALSVMFVIPPLMVFFVGQRAFVEGASFSGLKG